jgi:hypothetical protein
MVPMNPRGLWAAVSLCAGGAALFAACSQSSSPGASGDAGVVDSSTSDVVTAEDSAAGPDGSEAATADSGDANVDLDAGSLDAGDCAVGPSGEATELSCAGLYSNWATKTVAAANVAYTPGLQLWSDGAIKSRWIQLPPGQKIDTSNMDEWTFPVGTKLWKEFRLPVGDSSTPIRIETRLIWKQSANNWYRTTYRWSADGETSATELTAGELDANGDGYEVPSQYECNDCHQGRLDGVMGFEAVALSVPGATGITMQDLVAQGLVTEAPDAAIVIPGNAVESAALGFLHVNCGMACHNPGNGLGEPTGFFMRLDVETLASVQTTEAYTTGWNMQAGSYMIPSVPTTYLLEACNVGASAAYYRASVRDGINGITFGNQMPPIDTHVVDNAGLAILAAWLNEGCDGGDGG